MIYQLKLEVYDTDKDPDEITTSIKSTHKTPFWASHAMKTLISEALNMKERLFKRDDLEEYADEVHAFWLNEISYVKDRVINTYAVETAQLLD